MARYISIIALAAAIIAAYLILLGGETSRESKSAVAFLTPRETEKMIVAEETAKRDTFPLIKYRRFKIRNYADIARIRKEFSPKNRAKYKTFTTLNRKSLRYLRRGETVVIPDSFFLDQRAYSIFPFYYYGARRLPKLVVVSAAFQAYACYEYGSLVRFAATNTGKEKTQTYPGRYAFEWKEKEHLSSLDSNWKMPYTINFHRNAGCAFHQYHMPGRPVSHSCCRQFGDDAKWLFYWGEMAKRDSTGKRIPLSGTPVIIIDAFDFSRKVGGPWLELKSNRDTILPLPEDPMSVELALIPISQIPPGARWNLPGGKQRYVYAEDTLRARGIIRPGVKITPSINFNELRRKKAVREASEKEKKENKISR